MAIYSVTDNGRTHIAIGTSYVGAIDSYNNWFTRLFATIFALSVKTTINGKVKQLNRTDYAAFLQRQGIQATRDTIYSFSNFSSLHLAPQPSAGRMRDHISHEKASQLFHKLVSSAIAGRFDLATKYAGKGAELNQPFTALNQYSYTTNARFEEEFSHSPLTTDVTRYTPLLFVAHRGQKELAQFYIDLGATTSEEGQKIHFERKITSINHSDSVEPYAYSSRYRTNIGVASTHTEVTNFEDTKIETSRLQLQDDLQVREAMGSGLIDRRTFSDIASYNTGNVGISVARPFPYHHHGHRHRWR